MIFFGIVDRGNGIWGVRIPDLPGCHGGGRFLDEAVEDVTSAAADWVEHQIKNGRTIPRPSTVEAIEPLSDANEIVLEISVALM